MRYLIMIRRTPTGYSVDVPDLPGCIAAARTLKGARRLIGEAIPLHLDLMRQSGETVSAPRQNIDFVIDPDAMEEFCTWVDVSVPEPSASRAQG